MRGTGRHAPARVPGAADPIGSVVGAAIPPAACPIEEIRRRCHPIHWATGAAASWSGWVITSRSTGPS